MLTVAAALLAAALLFAVAWWGDDGGRAWLRGRVRPAIYALSLGVYCTSWTYYGSVGLASRHGLDFVPVYLGPILVIGLGTSLLRRVARIAHAQNLTSVADFVAARYGKSQAVAAIAAVIALVASAPYIALQLKAIVGTLLSVAASFEAGALRLAAPTPGLMLGVALALALFAMAFGTRRVDAGEHQDGLMLAIAAESVFKLAAFLAVGVFVVWGMFGGLGDIVRVAQANPDVRGALAAPPDAANWLVVTLLSACAVLLLPRQFHVAVVENRDDSEIAAARWAFPAYLALINLFVLPIAVAGLATFTDPGFDRDLTVLSLPLNAGARGLALLTMLGGLSAATGMVIVDGVALAITLSNNVALPLALRRSALSGAAVLWVRRAAILAVLTLGFAYARLAGEGALASFGLLSFTAIAQLAPAFLGGLFWRGGNARGAAAGMSAGIAAWGYLMLAPSLGFDGAAWPGAAALTGFSPFPVVGGALWSLGLNALCYVAFSLSRRANATESAQADVFLGAAGGGAPAAKRFWRAGATAGELEAIAARYLGAHGARRAFEAHAAESGRAPEPGEAADSDLLRQVETALAAAVGPSTSRFVLALFHGKRGAGGETALKLFDDAAAAIQSSRDQLQYALDHARQGITVFDAELSLRTWNREFTELFRLPPDFPRIGLKLEALLRFNAARGLYGEGGQEAFVAERTRSLLHDEAPARLRLHPTQQTLEIRSARLPDGGIVTTYTDVTLSVEAEHALARANEELEARVRRRTADLERLNGELAAAKTAAEEANVSKTRFLAAAGHDILQPLNAARLYASSLGESLAGNDEKAQLARNVDSSLEAVEEILGALLDMSRLDAGAIKPVPVDIALVDLFRQLEVEFGPLAKAKGLELTFLPSKFSVRSDRRMFRRVMQNLVSNAIKYTPRGRVLVGLRRVGGALRVEVWDTGLGIPEARQRQVFEEFQRLDEGVRAARGLGLGLSIVERIGRVLGAEVRLRSAPGKGSVFSILAPRGALVSRLSASGQGGVSAPAPEPLNGLVVLAIDNEPRVLDGMRSLLARWGCRIFTAAGLPEAVARLAEIGGAPDVIIADYHLDEGNGLFAIAALRARLGGEVAAILATADRSQELRDAAGRANVHMLNKPLKPAPLRALLMRALTFKRAAE